VGGAHGSAFTFRTEALGAEIDGRAEEVRKATAKNFAVRRSEVNARLRKRGGGELGVESVVESVVESPVALRLDRQPVPALRGKRP